MFYRMDWLGVVFGVTLSCTVGCSPRSQEPPAPGKAADERPAPETADQGAAAEKWQDHTQGLPFVVGYQQGRQKAEQLGKPAMMFVTATWCGWCKKLSAENFNDPEVKKLLENFVCVIVDGDTEEDAKNDLGATRGYPHIVFVSPQGDKLAECLGYRPVDQFKPIIQDALQRAHGG